MDSIKELLSLNVTDYVIIGVIFVSTIISLLRGFVKESISLTIWVIGFLVSLRFYQDLAVFLEPYISSSGLKNIISFVAIFLVVLIIGSLFNFLLSFIIEKTGLSGTDRLLGMLFGFAKGVLLVSVLLLVISSTSFVQDDWWKSSSLIEYFQPIVDWLRTFLPEKMTDIVGAIGDGLKGN